MLLLLLVVVLVFDVAVADLGLFVGTEFGLFRFLRVIVEPRRGLGDGVVGRLLFLAAGGALASLEELLLGLIALFVLCGEEVALGLGPLGLGGRLLLGFDGGLFRSLLLRLGGAHRRETGLVFLDVDELDVLLRGLGPDLGVRE